MKAPLDFYFDFSSPYGYLASHKIDALAARHGRGVTWRPILLGAAFKASGVQPLVNVPLKGEYSKHDFLRSARFHNVPFRAPDPFPVSTVSACRAFYATGDVRLARALFKAWWFPFSHYGVIHGDPHLGNYTVFETEDAPAGINLLDYGCMRTFAPKFIQGVIDLYRGLLTGDRALVVHAYETWGFAGLSNELIDILNIWANFIYGPMLEDRVRTIAEDRNIGMYGRREAFKVHQGLREKGPVKVPREFVFMDRAAIGLGGVFLHRGPFAFVRELVRQGRRNLEIIKPSPGYDVDLLCRANAARKVRAGIVAMEGNFGLARWYRRAIERKESALEEHA